LVDIESLTTADRKSRHFSAIGQQHRGVDACGALEQYLTADA
jgi:hypothetical protein